MYVELLSLFTALCIGANSVLVRMGMRDSNPITGALVGALVQVVTLSGFVLAVPPKRIDLVAIAFFMVSGVLASTLGRLSNYVSIERLGVAVSATIMGSSPLFATLFAVLFIGERVAVTVILGTILVVSGIALTRSGDSAGSRLRSTAILIPVASARRGSSRVLPSGFVSTGREASPRGGDSRDAAVVGDHEKCAGSECSIQLEATLARTRVEPSPAEVAGEHDQR